MTGAGFTPRVMKVFERARRIALDHGVVDGAGDPVIGTEHLFLAILDDPMAVPPQALANRYDVESLKAVVREVLETPEYRGRRPRP